MVRVEHTKGDYVVAEDDRTCEVLARFYGLDAVANAEIFAGAKNFQADAAAAGPSAILNNLKMVAAAFMPPRDPLEVEGR